MIPAPVLWRGFAQLVLTGQVNYVVGKVELHFVDWKIGERNLLREDNVAIAIVTEDRRAAVGANQQLPDLELFLSHARLVLLGDGDDVARWTL